MIRIESKNGGIETLRLPIIKWGKFFPDTDFIFERIYFWTPNENHKARLPSGCNPMYIEKVSRSDVKNPSFIFPYLFLLFSRAWCFTSRFLYSRYLFCSCPWGVIKWAFRPSSLEELLWPVSLIPRSGSVLGLLMNYLSDELFILTFVE